MTMAIAMIIKSNCVFALEKSRLFCKTNNFPINTENTTIITPISKTKAGVILTSFLFNWISYMQIFLEKYPFILSKTSNSCRNAQYRWV